MRKIGITGGVGAGKSTVLAYLEKMPETSVYQADLIAYELQLPGRMCYDEIIGHFGREILKDDGFIDRNRLASLVFSNDSERMALNALVHPAVNREIEALIEKETQKGTKVFVLEAALLTEEYYRTILDEIWYIYATEAVRRERLRQTRYYSEEKITGIMQAQASEEEFRKKCDIVINNSGAFADTVIQIEKVMKKQEQTKNEIMQHSKRQ